MKIRASKDLGALVRDRRHQLGLTQRQLAEMVGVSRIWLVALEKGKPSAQIDLVLLTLRELGLTLRIEVENPAAVSQEIDLRALLVSSPAKGK